MWTFLKNNKQHVKQAIIMWIIMLYSSKEIFVNDYEVVIIYCLLIFIIFNYFFWRKTINNLFLNIIEEIQQEYKTISYTLILIENNIKKMLYFYKWIHHFLNDIYVLLNKYLYLLKRDLIRNVVYYNYLVIKANKYKAKINLENRKKLSLHGINRAINIWTLNTEKSYCKIR